MSWEEQEVPPAPLMIRFVDSSMGECFWFDDDGALIFKTEISDYTNEDGAMVMARDDVLKFFRFLGANLSYEIEG